MLLVVSCWSSVAHAQGISIGAPPAPVQYTVIPEIPAPNATVNIGVAGVGNFVGNSPITWTLNGTVAKEGVGERTFSFTAGSLGVKTTVGVSIRSSEHGTITNTWVFTPSLVNLVWEARTTVPPLYGGKARYSLGSGIMVFAFPEVIQNGKRIPDSQLSFQWKVNGQPAVEKSGLGRSTLMFQGSQLRSAETASVEVFSNSAPVAYSEITIPAAEPQLILYAREALRGVLYNTALPNTHRMGGAETTVRAEPYYFSRTSLSSGSLVWSWTLNGNPTSGPNSGNGELTLRSQGDGGGSAVLGVSLQNSGATTFLQAAKNSVTLLFGAQQRSTTFGI